MFVNTMPRYEILSEDAMAVLDRGWRRIVTEIGIEFLLCSFHHHRAHDHRHTTTRLPNGDVRYARRT